MVNMNMGVSLLPQMAINSNILGPYPNILVDSNQLSEAYRDIGIIYRKSNPQSPSLLELSKLIQ
jgi:DNA-binding transcriptional LysR family regulator